MDFLSAQDGFGVVQSGELMKALTLGYGTDSANMTGGRALVPQDIEGTVISALKFSEQDFKMMNLIKSKKVGSSIHEYTRRKEVGDESNIFVSEGADSRETAQEIERVTRAVKYMQTYRKITLQMRTATTLEDAEASEKMAGVLTILKGQEWGMFHGDASVVPTQFDSIQTQIRASSQSNIKDLRGKTMATEGDAAFTEIARMVYENGGYLNHSFMPPLIAQDVQKLVQDRLRFNTGDMSGGLVVEKYPTPFSDEIKIAGRNAGPDKFFRVKSKPVASGDVTKRPDAPTIALAAQAKTGGTGFVSATAGTYYYQVFAISEDGISAGSAAASLAVAASQEAKITITPGAKPGTGFIVCRSKISAADGSDCREMFKIAKDVAATTIALDRNDELPGTGEILLLSHDTNNATIQWDQFLPTMRFDLYPTNAAIIPFLIVSFGTPDVKVPWYHGLIKNVGYTGFDWF